VYSDEDKINSEGKRYDEFRKPDWSPERLRGQMYTGHLSVLRASLVREVGGFRAGYDGAQDHDLLLRVTEHARRVEHVQEVLYHRRVVADSAAGDIEATPYAWIAGRRAVQDQLDRLGIAGAVSCGRVPGTYRIQRVADLDTSVSVIIPTRGGSGLVWGQRRCFVVEAVAYLGWVATIFGYTMWTNLIKRHGANRIAPFSLGVPVVGLSSGMLFLGESITGWQWAGIALIVAALACVLFGGRLTLTPSRAR